MNYQEWILEAVPNWARGKVFDKWWQTLGGYFDGLRLGVIEGVKAGMPAHAPEDALPYIADARGGLDRYPNESIGVWRKRLLAAWDRWQMAGTKAGLVAELEAFFAPVGTTIEVWSNNEVEDAFGPTGMGSHVDPYEPWWRFWVVLKPPLPWEPLEMPFTLGTASLGSTATANDFNKLRRIILKWSPSESLPAELYVLFSGDVTFTDFTGPFTGGADAMRIPMAKLLAYPGTEFLGDWTLGGTHLGDGQA